VKVTTARGAFDVDVSGKGPEVVLLHSLALSAAMWQTAGELLSPRFRVWSVDARGHGGSPWDGKPFTIGDMAEDLAAILDALDLAAVNLVGLSMGGSTAIAFAADHPERVTRLVLADTTANYGPDRVATWEERARHVLAKPREDQLDFQLDRWFTPTFVEHHPEEAQRIADIYLKADSAAHAAACRALGAFDGEPRLARIRADTLVIVGSDDYATPPSMAKRLADAMPRATYRELPRLRHLTLVEHPAVWREIEAHFE
jgi:3-oxoadipate enol-lactonase